MKRFFTILICLLRLCVVMLMTLFSALNKIFFDKMEIISASLIMRPQEPERNTLGFIDKLCANNRELVQGGVIPEANAFDNKDPFIPDDILIEGEELSFEGEELPPEDSLDKEEGKDDDVDNPKKDKGDGGEPPEDKHEG